MKNLLFIKLSLIILILILEVKGAKKKTNNKNNNNNNSNTVQDTNAVIAESAYCQHFKNTTLYLDRTKLKELDSIQFINAEFSTNKEKFTEQSKLDYFIRYSLISKGLCYYDEADVKELSKFPKFLVNYTSTYEDTIRYDKTFNCYYYYNKYIHESSRPELEKHRIAFNHCAQYLIGVYSFIYDTNLCPDPKPDMKGTYDDADPDIKANTTETNFYFSQRSEYIRELKDFYIELNATYHAMYPNEAEFFKFETDLEYDVSNLELTLCGYPTQQQKDEYCSSQRGRSDVCCLLTYNHIPYRYVFYKEPMYYGIAVASILIIIGSFFSSKIIKEIQMQENIKKSILNQEKEYQQSNQQNLQNAYNEGFDPKFQTFNSKSRNLNGTLRPNMGTLVGSETNTNSRLTMGSSMASNGMTLRNGGSMGRYPPNSFNVAEDYKSSDERDLSLKRGMIVQIVQKFEGGWVMVKDIQSNRQGYAPEYCLGNKMA